MLIKEASLLLVGGIDSTNGCVTVASLSSAGPCTVDTVWPFDSSRVLDMKAALPCNAKALQMTGST